MVIRVSDDFRNYSMQDTKEAYLKNADKMGIDKSKAESIFSKLGWTP